MDKTLGVLYTFQMNPYLEQQLSTRYNLFKLYDVPVQNRTEFLKTHAQSIRAIVGNAFVGADAEMIELLPKLEIVASFSVGLDKVDLEKCKEKGIRVTNTPDVLTDDVADLAIGLALAVMRKICEADRYVRRGSWKLKGEFMLTSKFSGKAMGIVGLGRIGSAIAKRAKAFGCSICYHSRSEKPSTNYTYYANVVDLAANSDVLVVACSLNKETHHIIDRKVLDALGPHGVLVNIGRGAHVDEPELVSALLEGRLGGAGLDVFEHEPHVPEGLFGLENVVIQSHVGSDTEETCQFSGKRVGIIGLGRIGAAIATRAEAFGCPISYHTRSKKQNSYQYYSSVSELASKSDVLIVACPLTPETRHIINREVIDALGPKGVLINIGRGPHVDEPELVKALLDGRLGGAGLDVFEHEPHVPEELFALDNVVLLPHVGSGTVETRIDMADLVLGNLEAHFLKKPLLTPVV